jgi:hypothetical protein
MMSTMAVMGTSLEKPGWTVGAASTVSLGDGKGRDARDVDVTIV